MRSLTAIALISAIVFAAPAKASDALIEGAKLCTRHLPRYEREYGIPTHLLSAIASTESGRYHDGLKIAIPWPWTINAEGKGYYFASKAEAIAAANKLRRQGIQSMDVGCMQVNLHHHSQAFGSLDEAFEPSNNIAYAASFLRSLYQQQGSWKKAAADYHSKTPTRGNHYVGRVYNSWYQIIDKLRIAKLQVSETTVVAMNAMKTETIGERVGAATVINAKAPKALPEQAGKKLRAYQPPRMNSIKLSKQESTREAGVIVVRPPIKVVDSSPGISSSVALAEAKPVVAAMPSAVTPKVMQVTHTPVAVTGNRKSGPTFIFND
jgi:hypothetical protein